MEKKVCMLSCLHGLTEELQQQPRAKNNWSSQKQVGIFKNRYYLNSISPIIQVPHEFAKKKKSK